MTIKEKQAHAAKMQKETAQAYDLARRLHSKYITQEIQYKKIGAPRKAIKANAERREAIQELLGVLIMLNDKYKKQEFAYKLQALRTGATARRYMQFTINH